jgi:RNA polymerase sigma-70 factor (ECF subfamily)
MPELAKRLASGLTAVDDDLEREFETRLAETSVLAFRVAYSVLRNREEAEDVAQNACLNAYRHFASLRGRDRFSAWLVRIAWRLAINRARGNRRRAAREEAPPESQAPATAEDIVASSERAAHVWRAIDELPEKLRTVVVLASIEDHQVADVARLLALPEGTVKSRLFLARKRLAEKLQWIAKEWTR